MSEGAPVSFEATIVSHDLRTHGCLEGFVEGGLALLLVHDGRVLTSRTLFIFAFLLVPVRSHLFSVVVVR